MNITDELRGLTNNYIRELDIFCRLHNAKIQDVGDKICSLPVNNTSFDFPNMGKMIKIRRKMAKLSRIGLADMAGVGKTVIYDIEKGKVSVRIDTLLKIFKVLNIKYVLYWE